MAEEQEVVEVNYEEQYRILSEENKKLSIDIASLQLSNRSLVNQNRDEKKKVMDCRLQISDLESRLRTLDSIKTELTESQTQAERLRQSLDANETKLAATERRATEAESLVKVKDSIIEKQRKFSKELEGKVQNLSEEVEGLKSKCGKLEVTLSEALDRADECDRLRENVAAKTALLDKIAESSGGVSESGLAAANQYFKEQEAKFVEQLAEMKQAKSELERSVKDLTDERDSLQEKIENRDADIESLREKCANLEASVKESKHSDKRTKGDMANNRLIGPSLPPWILEEKKPDPSEIEKLNNADPATLRARVLDLEGKVHELNQLLTYREDVILRIYQVTLTVYTPKSLHALFLCQSARNEIQKKASRLEAAEVERSSLSAQVSILKRELATLREDGGLRGGGRRYDGYPPEIEIEIERLRGKRDREYQRRKRAEAEMDEMEVELNEVKEKMKKVEEELAEIANAPKPVIHSGDPADKARITELQTAVNQLRLDNEAKRSELFDLRSRFDEKSAQLESFSSEMKTRERQVNDLTAELTTKTTQLEQVNKELEAVRLRVVRGGVETERWQTDLNSVRTTNRFLAQQTNELRLRLTTTEAQLIDAQKRIVSLLKSKSDAPLCNGVTEDDELLAKDKEIADLKSKVTDIESQLTKAKENVADLEASRSEINELRTKCAALTVELESEKHRVNSETIQNSDDTHRITQLLSDLKKEHQSSTAYAERCTELTKQLTELESTLAETRERLNEATSENRRADLEQAAAHAVGASSPPAKRVRRTRSSNANVPAAVSQECAACTELKRHVQALESDLADANTKIGNSVTELNDLRARLSEAGEEACRLRQEVSSLHEDLAANASGLKKLRHVACAYLEDKSSSVLAEQLRQLLATSMRLLRCLAASCHPVRLFPSPLTYAAQRCVQTFGMRFGFWSGLRSSLSALNSLTEVEGRLVGTDAMGNRYFEAEPDRDSEVPHRAARPKRFFLVPGQKSIEDSWVQLNTELPRLPSEWDAWLRYRRADPPTLEEIERNTKAAQIRAIKGRESEACFCICAF
ncbi:Ribosome-binding protein 1 (Ribosome receptor protein) [Echinococcus granulosus]|uniref:Ribosome-binding protein 1 (Ribosome receptor protein) n=1 Tax=Echinococcus granulosus TaxID=6210 RepID=W6V0Y3_ECHGR|nr:Ribosome-binding protein 1 (Ribosome receptor protein) [Echinococcus granulosus]EUB64567.1 Ribosome-binding protein 1 (Ribosome receptor protein) [Echinococcus granulosus]